MTGYYDYVLGLIPTALIGVTAGLNLLGASPTAAVSGGGGVAGAIVAHALFVRSPVTAGRGAGRSRDDRVEESIDRAIDRSRTDRSD